jgi:hypothetical protein
MQIGVGSPIGRSPKPEAKLGKGETLGRGKIGRGKIGMAGRAVTVPANDAILTRRKAWPAGGP